MSRARSGLAGKVIRAVQGGESMHSVCFRVAGLLVLVFGGCGCSPPPRPPGVDPDSTWVESVKGGYWQRCGLTTREGLRCTIWNQDGTVLVDEPFRSIDGGWATDAAALRRLRTSGPCTGAYQVCLADGRVLLPVSRFEEMKAFIEGRIRPEGVGH